MSPESFGQRLKRLRLTLGLTQLELGRRADLSPQAIHLIETGQRQRMQRANLKRTAEALGVTSLYLEYGVEAAESSPVLPSFDVYLRATSRLAPDQIHALRRTYEAFEAERQLREIEAGYDTRRDEAATDQALADEQRRIAEDMEPA